MICTILNFIVTFLCAYISFNALRFDMLFSISVITVCLIMMYKMMFYSPCGRGRVLYERLKMKKTDTKEENKQVMKEGAKVPEKGKVEEETKQKDKAVFRFIYADWCGYCVRTKPIWKTLEEQYPMVNGFNIDYQLLDSEDSQNKAMMKKFKVKAYPYIALEHNGENKVYKGERSVSGFVEFLIRELR